MQAGKNLANQLHNYRHLKERERERERSIVHQTLNPRLDGLVWWCVRKLASFTPPWLREVTNLILSRLFR